MAVNTILMGTLLMGEEPIKPSMTPHIQSTIMQYKPDAPLTFIDTPPDMRYILRWVEVDGILVADRVLLTNISWDDLDRQDLTLGKRITIDEQDFTCRLLRIGSQAGQDCEWERMLDRTGEEDDIWHCANVGFWGLSIDESTVEKVFRYSTWSASVPLPTSQGHEARGFYSPRAWLHVQAERSVSVGYRPMLIPAT